MKCRSEASNVTLPLLLIQSWSYEVPKNVSGNPIASRVVEMSSLGPDTLFWQPRSGSIALAALTTGVIVRRPVTVVSPMVASTRAVVAAATASVKTGRSRSTCRPGCRRTR